MSDQAAPLNVAEGRGRGGSRKWLLLGIVALVVIGAGGGAAWYFLLGGRGGGAAAQQKVETPLPYFLELKPFVVTMTGSNGNSHFVQLGISLQLPRPAAGEMVTALLPEIQDAIRETLLGFKSDDLQSPEGVAKVRRALIHHLNEVLAAALGPERVAKVTDGGPNPTFVQNILFPTVIVE